MQIFVLLVFLVIWLLVLWIGSIALESTGMERAHARFQALSAISGTGFTTRQSEGIVEHPKRRRIVSYLIFIGNAGILSFIVVLLLYVRQGLTLPSTASIVVTVVVLLAIGLAIWLGLIDIITNSITGAKRKKKALTSTEILYQSDNFAVIKVGIGAQMVRDIADFTVAKFQEKNVRVIAIERDKTALSMPEPDIILQAGDSLICTGNPENISSIT